MTDKKFFVEEIEVLTPEDLKDGKDEGTIWPAVTCNEPLVSFECRNEDVAKELCEYMNKQEEKLFIEETDCKNAKESRDYWRKTCEKLINLIYELESDIIYERGTCREMEELDELYKDKDIEKIIKFCGG